MKTWENIKKRFYYNVNDNSRNAINILEEFYNLELINTIAYYTNDFPPEELEIVKAEVRHVWGPSD